MINKKNKFNTIIILLNIFSKLYTFIQNFY